MLREGKAERKARLYKERVERERLGLQQWPQEKPLLKRQRSTEQLTLITSTASGIGLQPAARAASLQLLQQLEARVGGDPALIERNRAAAAAKLDAARDAAAAEATAARELLAAVQGRPEDSLSEFTLLDEIAEGGFGRISRAFSARRGHCVVKRLQLKFHGDERRLALFRAEVAQHARLRHDNIIQLLAGRCSGDEPFLVLPFCARGSLREALARGGLEEPRLQRSVLAGIASGMAYLHGEGVLHLDLKPANVLLTTGGRPLVSDFGLAEEARLHLRERRGTPRWRAPEVLREGARFGKPADVWSFGCVAACVVMGMGHPYERPTPHIDTTNMCARALEVQVCLGSLRPSVPEGS